LDERRMHHAVAANVPNGVKKMIKSHRHEVLMFAAVMMSAASLASAQVSAVYRPEPYLPCGDYTDCDPKPWNCRRQPCGPGCEILLDGAKGAIGAATTSIADGDINAASQSLDGLFSGSGVKPGAKNSGSNASAVYAGGWALRADSEEKPGFKFSDPMPKLRRSTGLGHRTPTVVPVACGDAQGCKSDLGKIIEDFVDAVTSPIERHVERDRTPESREEYGGCRMKGTCSK
jgi:hypothetical protein